MKTTEQPGSKSWIRPKIDEQKKENSESRNKS